MTQKNETAILVSALVVTLSLVGGVYFWVSKSTDLSQIIKPEPKINDQKLNDRTLNNPSQNNQTLANTPNVPSGLFRYGGSTTWAPIRLEVDAAIQAAHPEFRLTYVDPVTGTPGTASGIRMLIDNQLAFSQASRSLKSEEQQQAKQKGFTLKEIPVAIDGIAVAVNPNLDIPGLTVTQLKDIYTGKITNWNQVGSKQNLPIVPYSRRIEDGGTVQFFVEYVLEKGQFSPNVKLTPNTTQALRDIIKNPGSIYYASASEVVGQCQIKSLPLGRKSDQLVTPYQEPSIPTTACPQRRNQVNIPAFQKNEYPITRQLFVIIKQNDQADQRAGQAYTDLLLTDQGQKLVTKAGFVRIK